MQVGQCSLLQPVTFSSFDMPGRSITIKNGNVSKAIKILAMRLRDNGVIRTWKYQMRYEKKGVKRRRLSSERWRRRFSDEVSPYFCTETGHANAFVDPEED